MNNKISRERKDQKWKNKRALSWWPFYAPECLYGLRSLRVGTKHSTIGWATLEQKDCVIVIKLHITWMVYHLVLCCHSLCCQDNAGRREERMGSSCFNTWNKRVHSLCDLRTSYVCIVWMIRQGPGTIRSPIQSHLVWVCSNFTFEFSSCMIVVGLFFCKDLFGLFLCKSFETGWLVISIVLVFS